MLGIYSDKQESSPVLRLHSKLLGEGSQAKVFKTKLDELQSEETTIDKNEVRGTRLQQSKSEQQSHSAVKAFYYQNTQEKEKVLRNYYREVIALQGLKGKKNIIQLKESNSKAFIKYKSKNGDIKTEKVAYVELQYISKAQTLHNIIKKSSKNKNHLSERLVWNYFAQLMQGINDIHGNEELFEQTGYIGRAHRDLKPKNILIDRDQVLKIIDFGLSSPIIDEDGAPKPLKGYCGSRPFMAPEVIDAKESNDCQYYVEKVDLFSCGVILFNMVSGTMPFKDSSHHDEQYQHVIKNDFDNFWKGRDHCFTEKLKALIQNMLHPSPAKRKGFAEFDYVKYAQKQIDLINAPQWRDNFQQLFTSSV